MQKKYYCSLSSPIGSLFICQNDDALSSLSCTQPNDKDERIYEITPLLKESCRQLEEYFKGERKSFSLPISFPATPFKKRVYEELSKIPYGRTVTYKELASMAGSPNAARAVGSAMASNPIMIILPCHRVLGSDGSLAGYAYGTQKKEYLLNLEKSHM